MAGILRKKHLIDIFLCIYLFTLVFADEKVINGNKLCNTTVSELVDYEFSSDILPKQHIITYKGYFTRSTRENYIGAALKNAGCAQTCGMGFSLRAGLFIKAILLSIFGLVYFKVKLNYM